MAKTWEEYKRQRRGEASSSNNTVKTSATTWEEYKRQRRGENKNNAATTPKTGLLDRNSLSNLSSMKAYNPSAVRVVPRPANAPSSIPAANPYDMAAEAIRLKQNDTRIQDLQKQGAQAMRDYAFYQDYALREQGGQDMASYYNMVHAQEQAKKAQEDYKLSLAKQIVAEQEQRNAQKAYNVMDYHQNPNKLLSQLDGNGSPEMEYLPVLNMTNAEATQYATLLKENKVKEAGEYLNSIMETLNVREGQRQAKLVEGKPVAEVIYGLLGAGLDSRVQGMRQRFTNDVLPVSPTQYAGQMIKEDLADRPIASALYDVATGIGYMAPSMALGFLGAPVAGAAALGLSSGGNNYAEMRRAGYSEEQAMNYSILSGAAEAIMQYLIGGIKSLGGKLSGNVVKNAVSNIDNALLRVATQTGLNMASEGAEEYIQSILDPVLRNMTLGENNEFRIFSPDAAYDFLIGAITAGLLEAPRNISGGIRTTRLGKGVMQSGNTEQLISNALLLDKKTDAYKLADKLRSGKLRKNTGNLGELMAHYSLDGGNLDFMKTPNAEQIAKSVRQLEEQQNMPQQDANMPQQDANMPQQDANMPQQTDGKPAASVMPENPAQVRAAAAETQAQEQIPMAEKNGAGADSAGLGSVGRMAVSESYNPSQDRAQYEAQMSEYYKAGRSGKSESSVVLSGSILTPEQKRAAYLAGQADRNEPSSGFNGSNSINTQLQNAAAEFDVKPEVFASEYNSSLGSEEDYINAYRMVYNAAKSGLTYEQATVDNMRAQANLTAEARQSAYAAGAAPKIGLNNRYTQGALQKAASNMVKSSFQKVTKESVKSAMDNIRTQIRLLGSLGKKYGIKIVVQDSIDVVSPDGTVRKGAANGSFDPNTGTITIALDAVSEAYMFVGTHELVHYIKQFNQSGYNSLETLVFEALEKNGQDVDALVKYQMEHNGYSEQTAREEVVANSVPAILRDKATVKRIVETDRTLAKRIAEFFKEFAASLRKIMQRLSAQPSWKQLDALKNDVETLQKISDAFFEALEGKNESASGKLLETEFSSKYPADIDFYTQKQYDTFGWARVNDVISYKENATFRSRLSDQKNGAQFPRTSDGKYLFAVGEEFGINNVIIVSDGNYLTPSIDRIYRIHFNIETHIEIVRSVIYDQERTASDRAREIIENHFEKELVSGYELQDFPDYFKMRASGKGINGKKNQRTYHFEQDGSGDNRKDSGNGEVNHSSNSPDIKRSTKDMTPAQIASITTKDADTTPVLPRMNPTGINAETGKESSLYQSSMESDYVSTDLQNLVKTWDDVKYYLPITNTQTLEEANNRLNAGGEAETNRFIGLRNNDLKQADAVDVAEGFILLKRYQDKGDYKSALTVLTTLREIGTKAGQVVQLFSLLGRMTPEGMSVYAQKELDSARDEMIKLRGEKWVQDHAEMFKLTEEEMSFIRSNIEAASKLPEGRDKNILLAEIAAMIEAKLPTSVMRQLKAFARNSMLLNSKTMLRNIIGNAIMMPAYVVQDFVASGVDKLAAKKTGVRTSGATFVNKSALKSAKKGVFESYDDFRRHINTRQAEGDRFEIGKGDDFKRYTREQMKLASPARRSAMRISNALNKVDRITGFLLDVGDRPFFEYHFTNSINNQLRLNDATEPTESMIGIATNEALQRTWQDDNGYTKFVSRLRDGLNLGKEFGVGSLIVPFTKTPANLTKALVEYSPVGLVNAIAFKAKKFMVNPKSAQAQKAFVDSISKGITGTLFMAVAAALANAGLISGGNDEKDKDLAAFEQNVMGIAPYSVTVDGKSYTYDWAQPIGGLFAISADFIQNIKAGNEPGVTGLDVLGTTANAILNALSAGGNVIFEQSFLSGVADLFAEDGVVQGLIQSLGGSGAQFVPTALSQIAQIIDPTARTSFVYRDVLQTSKNKMITKIPFAKSNLAPVVDVMGNEVVTVSNDFLENAYGAFINPANVYSSTATESAIEIYRVYQETGETSVVPQKAPYKVEEDGKEYTFTPHERADYQKETGQTCGKLVKELLSLDSYRKLSDDEKAEVLSGVVSYSVSMAQKNFLATKGVSKEVSSWIEKANGGKKVGLTVGEYIIAREAVAGIKSLKDRKGETIENSKSLQIMDAIYSIPGLNEKKRKYLFEELDAGKSVMHYNPELVKNQLKKMKKM